MKKTRYQNFETKWMLAVAALLFTGAASAIGSHGQMMVACALPSQNPAEIEPPGDIIICDNNPKGCYPPGLVGNNRRDAQIVQISAAQCQAAAGVVVGRVLAK